MRTLRRACELAVPTNAELAQLGVAQLEALNGSDLLGVGEKIFVEAALQSALDIPRGRIEAGDESVDVVVEEDTT